MSEKFQNVKNSFLYNNNQISIKMYKILFICTGNICRSPTAEGYMQKIVREAGLEAKIFVDSAGTSSYHNGDEPDGRAVECALRHGLDLSCLRSRPLCADDFAEFDLILAMDSQNIWNIEQKRPHGDSRYERAIVKKLLEYAPAYGEDVPDPYYGSHGFENVYQMISSACDNLLQELSVKLNSPAHF